MRLIDADELKSIIDGNENLIGLQKEELKLCVDACETAYDVDKVAEQLDEIREEILTDTAYDNDTVNHYLEYADLMIEDVKAGGVNE